MKRLPDEESAKMTGMIPFMAVTGEPTEKEVRAKVAAIQANGAESFLLYARSGLQVPYMGEKWLNIAEWFCDEASKRGMKVWLYDEYNWPSGTCKGRVPAENEAWRYREAGVFPRPGGGWRWEEAVAPAGWVNVCEPEAVRRFIELTHEVYAKRLARFFADGTILGFFTDEPGHPVGVTYNSGTPRAIFRLWSSLEEDYHAETGRDFRADAEAWLDSCASSFPATYARLMGRRFRTSYFDQIRSWCDAHGVAFTGHMISENSLAGSCRFNGDPMLCLRGESIPGMDEICSAFDPEGTANPGGRPVEWLTFNMVRQAILHNGRGGMAELFACGSADLPPAAARTMVWLCAFHGIDRYVTCMDVMDERGLVEKHGYLSGCGPAHPWYARHARLFADECRRAAAFAAKRVSEREVGVRHPDRAAADAAFFVGEGDGIWGGTSQPVPDIHALLRALETHQFTCRLVPEDEPCDLPLVFTCRADGTFDEEKAGAAGLDTGAAIALCRERLPSAFRVYEADGKTEADALMVRTCEDGTSAVLNMRAFATRRLVATRGSGRCAFTLPPHGVKVFAPGPLPPSEAQVVERRSLAGVKWSLRRDRPNLLRVRFPEDGGRRGIVTFAEEVEAQPLARDLSAPAAEARGDSAASVLPAPFAPLYLAQPPLRFPAGCRGFSPPDGAPDTIYFLPALWLAGEFRVFGEAVFAETDAPVGFGSFAALGYPHYAGAIAWNAEVSVPAGSGWRLRAETDGAVASVRLCGVELGARAWEPFEWDIPESLSGKGGELEITIVSTAKPMFGPHEVKDKTWDTDSWDSIRTPGADCGLFSAEWVKDMEASAR